MDLPKKGEVVPLPKIKEICDSYKLPDLWAKIENDPPPKPFQSDGCSMWFDEWGGNQSVSACFLHDLKYWAGHPSEEVERLIADAELMIAVATVLRETAMAETMFYGVGSAGTKSSSVPFHGALVALIIIPDPWSTGGNHGQSHLHRFEPERRGAGAVAQAPADAGAALCQPAGDLHRAAPEYHHYRKHLDRSRTRPGCGRENSTGTSWKRSRR